jgi:hypothetical protein
VDNHPQAGAQGQPHDGPAGGDGCRGPIRLSNKPGELIRPGIRERERHPPSLPRSPHPAPDGFTASGADAGPIIPVIAVIPRALRAAEVRSYHPPDSRSRCIIPNRDPAASWRRPTGRLPTQDHSLRSPGTDHPATLPAFEYSPHCAIPGPRRQGAKAAPAVQPGPETTLGRLPRRCRPQTSGDDAVTRQPQRTSHSFPDTPGAAPRRRCRPRGSGTRRCPSPRRTTWVRSAYR